MSAPDTKLLDAAEKQVEGLLLTLSDVGHDGTAAPLFTLDEKLKIIDRAIKIAALKLKVSDEGGEGSAFNNSRPPWMQRPTGEDPRDQ